MTVLLFNFKLFFKIAAAIIGGYTLNDKVSDDSYQNNNIPQDNFQQVMGLESAQSKISKTIEFNAIPSNCSFQSVDTIKLHIITQFKQVGEQSTKKTTDILI